MIVNSCLDVADLEDATARRDDADAEQVRRAPARARGRRARPRRRGCRRSARAPPRATTARPRATAAARSRREPSSHLPNRVIARSCRGTRLGRASPAAGRRASLPPRARRARFPGWRRSRRSSGCRGMTARPARRPRGRDRGHGADRAEEPRLRGDRRRARCRTGSTRRRPGAIIYALFCTSRQISTGPSSSLAAVAGGAVLGDRARRRRRPRSSSRRSRSRPGCCSCCWRSSGWAGSPSSSPRR